MAMSISTATLNSYPSLLKPSLIPSKTHKFHNPFPQFTLPSSSPITTTQSFNSTLTAHASFTCKKFGYPLNSRRNNNNNNNHLLGFCLNSSENGEAAAQGGESSGENEDLNSIILPPELEVKYNPQSPIPWWLPYALALPLLWAWRVILWEVGNWMKFASTPIWFLAEPLKVFVPVGRELVFLIRSVLVFCIQKLAAAPIKDLRLIIVLTSIILAIGETAVPDSMSSQPHVMTFAGVVGYAAVTGFIPEPFFWAILVGLFGFSRFIKKKDYISSTLPVAAVLAAVGEPWVRFIVMASFLALAIAQYWKNPSEEKEPDIMSVGNRVPFPLVCAGLAIALRAAAKWARYRQMAWIIV